MQPADTDVELDESMFIDALLPLQDAIHLPSNAETAWHELLVTGYDLCFAHLHDHRTRRNLKSFSPLAEAFLETVFRDQGGRLPDEHSLSRMHERLLEFIPVIDPGTRRLAVHEATRERRRHRGAFYTPDTIIDGLLDRGLDPLLDAADASDDPLKAILSLQVCDPACGTGHFLVRAADRIVQRAMTHVPDQDLHQVRVHVLGNCLHGSEIDPISAHVCRRRLWSLAADGTLPPSLHEQRIHCGSGLLGAPPQARSIDDADRWCSTHLGSDGVTTVKPVHWNLYCEHGFDLVIGNPPFHSKLGSKTSLARNAAALLRERFGDSVKGYTDPAAIFLRLSIDLAKPGGRIAMIQPQSMLATRDAQGIRRDLALAARLTNIWLAIDHVFDAAVHVCAPVLERTSERTSRLRRSTGIDFLPVDEVEIDMDRLAGEDTWSSLVSDLVGIPRISTTPSSTIDDIAGATADFRDQYYGLRGMVSEAPMDGPDAGHVPLVTTGLIDPAASYWGQRSMRYDRQRWKRPQVDLQALAHKTTLGPWADARLVPKILLATQTRVLEAYVDEIGELLPMTPLITIVPDDADRIWHLAAALSSPVMTAIAAGRYFGVARSTHAIKLAASQVLSLPLPEPGQHWDEAAVAFHAANDATNAPARAALLLDAARASCRAYGCRGKAINRFMDWWVERAGLAEAAGQV